MLWRPEGALNQDSARWDTHPELMTYFLQVLANEKREGRFLMGNPNNTHYNLLIRSFWEKFNVYHTKAQFKNYFTAKKQLWNLLCWAQNCTGISWDEGRKMIIASPDWWDANKERKRLSAIRDKSIPDYDLLELVFRGQHAEGAYMRDPHVPRYPVPESVGESDPSNVAPFSDPPDIDSPLNVAENPRRFSTPSSQPRRKKAKTNTTTDKNSSPIVENINSIMGGWFEKMEEARLRRQESRTVESVSNRPSPAPGSLAEVVRVLVGEMKMDLTSQIFQQCQVLFEEKKIMRAVLMECPPETRWPWLMKTLGYHAETLTPSKARPRQDNDC